MTNGLSNILHKISETLDDCLILLDYGNCVFWLFGLSSEDAPQRARLWEQLSSWRERVDQVLDSRRRAVIMEPDRFLSDLLAIREECEQDRETCKNGLIRILCTDEELRSIAQKVKDGEIVSFSKAEFDQRFDLSSVDPFWCYVPNYTQVFVGGGLGLSSPEWDMFYAMCQSHDRAIRTGQELETARQRIVMRDDSEAMDCLVAQASHMLEVRQVIVDAFLFIEAFINSVVHAYRSRPLSPLLPRDDLYLRERVIDRHTGTEREKFVPLHEKLHRWVQLISPRGETFDKGTDPYQAFRKVQSYRDSIVHMSSNKVIAYNSINLRVAKEAVHVAFLIARAICCYIAPDASAVRFPKWLVDKRPDGMFHVLPRLDLGPKQSDGGEQCISV